jgi:predicted dehydrogenase
VAGSVTAGFSGSYFGTEGSIVGTRLNGRPLDLPGGEDGYDRYRTLPHVVGAHQSLEEMHVYEDIMQLVDWIREDRPSIVTAEHARHVIEIIEAAYRAAETGQTQTLTTVF